MFKNLLIIEGNYYSSIFNKLIMKNPMCFSEISYRLPQHKFI